MTDPEICRSFLQAADRQHQIKVLSELTLHTKDEIETILFEHGIDPEQPAPKYAKANTNCEDREIHLPPEIRKEVLKYVNKGYRLRRH